VADKKWYVVHVYSGFERKIAEQIKQQAAQKGLADKFDEVLVPTEQVVEVRRGQKVDTDRKFFPGYVLVALGEGYAKGHRLPRRPQQAPARAGFGSGTPAQANAGRCGQAA